jgi:hypothetical protein
MSDDIMEFRDVNGEVVRVSAKEAINVIARDPSFRLLGMTVSQLVQLRRYYMLRENKPPEEAFDPFPFTAAR